MKKLLYISLLIMLFAACKGDPIFYALENEEKIEDSNNFKSGTPVSGIIKFNDAGLDYFMVHGKQLWYSAAGTEQSPWQIIPKPEGYGSSSIVSSIALYNNRVYVSLFDGDNNSKAGLYYIESVSGSLKKVFEYERRPISGNDYYFYTLKLFSVNSGLYIVRVDRKWSTDTSNSSSVAGTDMYYFNTDLNMGSNLESGTAVSLPGLSGNSYDVKSFTTTAADTNEIYLTINELGNVDYSTAGKLFVADTSSPASFTEEDPGERSSYNTVYYSSYNKILLISTKESGRNHSILYKLNDGGIWSSWQTDLVGGDDVQFSAFTDITAMGKGKIILAGTKAGVIGNSYYNGKGYFEINLTDRNNPIIQSNTFALDTNYNSTDLKNATIENFLYDTVTDKIYCSTSSYGLWLNQVDETAQRKWFQE